jgi:hypothetical protein
LQCEDGDSKPRWLLTASTSSGIKAADSNDFSNLQRQETSELVPKRLILAELGQNFSALTEAFRARIATALGMTTNRWLAGATVSQLRVELLAVLAALESDGAF